MRRRLRISGEARFADHVVETDTEQVILAVLPRAVPSRTGWAIDAEPRRSASVKHAEIAVAVETFPADPRAAPFEFASGHTLDVAATAEAHRPAKAIMGETGTMDV